MQRNIYILSPLMRPNFQIDGEVEGNTFSGFESQYSSGITLDYIYCESRNNKFALRAEPV